MGRPFRFCVKRGLVDDAVGLQEVGGYGAWRYFRQDLFLSNDCVKYSTSITSREG